MYSVEQTARIISEALEKGCINGHDPEYRTIGENGNPHCVKCRNMYYQRRHNHNKARKENNSHGLD